MKCHIRSTLYHLCFFFQTYVKIRHFSFRFNDLGLLFRSRECRMHTAMTTRSSHNRGRKKKKKRYIYIYIYIKRKRKKIKGTNVAENEWIWILSWVWKVSGIVQKKKKKNKMNKKRNGNSRKTDDTTALLPDNLSTNKY